MRLTGRTLAVAVAAALGVVGAFGASALFLRDQRDQVSSTAAVRPVWSEVRWTFPVDPWGKGKAFRCKTGDCGSEVNLYVGAKLGFCNCTTGVADDTDLDRMGDLDLIGGQVVTLGAGQPITVGTMKGRSRAYAVTARGGPGRTVISIAFNERCDMITGIAVLQHDNLGTIETAVLVFLNSSTMRHWAEVSLDL